MIESPLDTIANLQRDLLAWFRENQRDLPWRRTRDPYRILVSEVMLQQTQVDRVKPKYEAFLDRFPTLQALAEAPVSEVIRAWQGLGYNRRAVNLQRAAQTVVEQHGGRFPEEPEELIRLPGIGAYTAGAIACFAFERDVAFLDTNIRRVIRRLFCGPDEAEAPEDALLLNIARQAIPSGQGWEWNQGVMELGALICTATSPACWRCPVRAHCAAYAARSEADSTIFSATGSAASGSRPRRLREQQPFTSTNRYFRGRIVDILRTLPAEESIDLEELGVQIKAGFSAADLPWLAKLVEGLVGDGLAAWRARDGAELARWQVALPA